MHAGTSSRADEVEIVFQMNLVFLCNIVRVLVTKLRAVNSPDTIQAKLVATALPFFFTQLSLLRAPSYTF